MQCNACEVYYKMQLSFSNEIFTQLTGKNEYIKM